VNTNIALNPGFTQVCVWPGTIVGADMVEQFTQFFQEEMGVRVQYLEEIVTGPDWVDGQAVADTGGRNDCFFAVHSDDVGQFAVPRLSMGIRWLEDMYSNRHGDLYPARVVEYMSWDGYQEAYTSA
jgi:hypothetical protein